MKNARVLHLFIAAIGMTVALLNRDQIHYVIIGSAMYAANAIIAAIFAVNENRGSKP